MGRRACGTGHAPSDLHLTQLRVAFVRHRQPEGARQVDPGHHNHSSSHAIHGLGGLLRSGVNLCHSVSCVVREAHFYAVLSEGPHPQCEYL